MKMQITNIPTDPWCVVPYALIAAWLILKLTSLGGLVCLWRRAFLSAAPVQFMELLGMRWRGTDPNLIVDTRIRLIKAEAANVPAHEIETHLLAGGRVSEAADALISARARHLDLTWYEITQADLAREDLVSYVQKMVTARDRETAAARAGRSSDAPPPPPPSQPEV